MVVRATELKQLEQMFEQSGNSLMLLYGQQGCEKEALISLLMRGKKTFYYRCPNVSAKEQLAQLQREITKRFDVNLSKDTYDECFNRIKSGDASKLLVVIDEFQNIAKKDPAFLESILKLRARRLYPGPVMIVLCSSSIPFAEIDFPVMPGAERMDLSMKLSDVGFLDVVRAFPDYSVAQCVETYGILGGVPAYLNGWNGKLSIKENICNHILNPRGFLFKAAENYISSELRELSVYETILASIARGNEKLNDLYSDTGYSRAKLSVYMKNLAAFDVVEKTVSFETSGWENAKKGIYRIRHNYINFYFRFIYPHLSDLYVMTPEEFYDAYLEKELAEYLQRYFASVCHEYLWLINKMGQLPLKLEKMGTWLGKEGNIDIIGQDSSRNRVVGSCNWDDKTFSIERYENLVKSMKKAKIDPVNIYLFSATTFASELVDLAKKDDKIVLVDMTEL